MLEVFDTEVACLAGLLGLSYLGLTVVSLRHVITAVVLRRSHCILVQEAIAVSK